MVSKTERNPNASVEGAFSHHCNSSALYFWAEASRIKPTAAQAPSQDLYVGLWVGTPFQKQGERSCICICFGYLRILEWLGKLPYSLWRVCGFLYALQSTLSTWNNLVPWAFPARPLLGVEKPLEQGCSLKDGETGCTVYLPLGINRLCSANFEHAAFWVVI